MQSEHITPIMLACLRDAFWAVQLDSEGTIVLLIMRN